MFTLAHEIAHLWLGESGVSNPQADFVEDSDFVADAESTPHHSSELWCNNVAAELLLPANVLCKEFSSRHTIDHRGQSTGTALQGQRGGRPCAESRTWSA